MNEILKYLIVLIIFLVIDLLWLLFIARDIYKTQLGYLMASKPNFIAAFTFYLIFIAGLLIFAINPALEKESIKFAISFGALFGFFTYATYDLTNLATLKAWPIKITIIDLIWGTFLGSFVSGFAYLIITLFN